MNNALREAKIEVLFYRGALEEAERQGRLPKVIENVEKIAAAKKRINRLRKKLIASVQKMEDLMEEPNTSQESHRYTSPFIGKAYTVLHDRQVVFDGGISFSYDEAKLLEGRGQDAVLSLYRVKEVFGNGAQMLSLREKETAG